MGRFKTHDERLRKIMAKKELKREQKRLLKKISIREDQPVAPITTIEPKRVG